MEKVAQPSPASQLAKFMSCYRQVAAAKNYAVQGLTATRRSGKRNQPVREQDRKQEVGNWNIATAATDAQGKAAMKAIFTCGVVVGSASCLFL